MPFCTSHLPPFEGWRPPRITRTNLDVSSPATITGAKSKPKDIGRKALPFEKNHRDAG
jgi:hypothetical protein